LTRFEAQRGVMKIERYLAKWAAFERWVAVHR
jgi:hypothetical protein